MKSTRGQSVGVDVVGSLSCPAQETSHCSSSVWMSLASCLIQLLLTQPPWCGAQEIFHLGSPIVVGEAIEIWLLEASTSFSLTI